MTAKVSIVLPNYNYERYLDERIQSLLNQTFRDFELIIVDDASTDNSLEVIKKYTHDDRVKTQFYEQNSGFPYKRWNDGATLATGEYILFAGADDSCAPDMLERLVEKLDSHPNVGVAYVQSWEIDSEGAILRSMKEYTDDLDHQRWAQDFVDQGQTECRYMMTKCTIPNCSAALIRHDIFKTIGGFNEQLKLVADWMFWVQVMLISDVAYICEPLNNFRTHPNTVRNSVQKNALHLEEIYQVLSKILATADIPQVFCERAFNKMTDRWLNATIRLMLTQPAQAVKQARKTYRVGSTVDSRFQYRLTKRVLKDISTLGILTLRERAQRR